MQIKTKDEIYEINVNKGNPYELIITCLKKDQIIIKPLRSDCSIISSEDD